MEIKNNSSSTINKRKYSEMYYAIRHEMETQWPEWKVQAYNEQYAITKHSKKLVSKIKQV